jgi:hypothetical protein
VHWVRITGAATESGHCQPKKLMPMNFIGKAMFPRLPRWQSRRQAIHLVAALAVGVLFAAVIVAVMFLQNGHR